MIVRHGSISDFFLKVSDLSLLLASLGLAVVYRYSPAHNPTFVVDYLSERIKVTNALLGVMLLLAWYASFAAQGLYVSHRLSTIAEELKEVARAVLFSSGALLVAAQLGHWPTINAWTVAAFALVAFGAVTVARMGLRLNLRRLRARGHNVKTLLIIGGGARGRRFAAQLKRRYHPGYKLLGYVDSDPAFAGDEIAGASWLGRIEELPTIVANGVIDEVAIALPIKSHYSQIEWVVGLLEEQ